MKYYIMWKDIPTVEFDTELMYAKFIEQGLAPMCIQHSRPTYDMVRVFCSNRMLMTNREYCKEILTSCEIEDQTDVNICIVSKALSFRDNYWIKKADSCDCWQTVNLYENEFSNTISKTALTGATSSVEIGDKFYTGELTNKGTRAKCFMRNEGSIFLVKNETIKEIAAEIISYLILSQMTSDLTPYAYYNVYGKDCSICEIKTSSDEELIMCRDILQYCNSEFKAGTPYYKMFLEEDMKGFLLMQVFDFLTLNTDRNRDNFGLRRTNGKLNGMYTLYDHDSCFKGKSIKAYYFVTGGTFESSINNIVSSYGDYFKHTMHPVIMRLYLWAKEHRDIFEAYGLEQEYDGFLERIEYLLRIIKEKSEFDIMMDIMSLRGK